MITYDNNLFISFPKRTWESSVLVSTGITWDFRFEIGWYILPSQTSLEVVLVWKTCGFPEGNDQHHAGLTIRSTELGVSQPSKIGISEFHPDWRGYIL